VVDLMTPKSAEYYDCESKLKNSDDSMIHSIHRWWYATLPLVVIMYIHIIDVLAKRIVQLTQYTSKEILTVVHP
jgi:hypothetical protein